MYSIVLLAAMGGAPEMPAMGGRRGGCCGEVASCGCQGRGGLFGRRGGGGCCGNGGGYGGGCYGGGGYGGGCYGGGGYGAGCCGQVAQSCGCQGYAGGGYGGYAVAPVNGTATIVVTLPADAKLLFDGVATTATGASRRFATPTLNPGVELNYTVTAEIVREGKTLKASQVVTVRAGQMTSVNLNDAQFGIAVASR